MSYDIGDLITLSTLIRNVAGTPVNTPTVVIAVTKPDGTLVAPAPTVTNTAAGGLYTAPLTPDAAGVWSYVWTASGTVVAVEPGQITVGTGRVLVASVEELKTHTNTTTTVNDNEMRVHLAAATDRVEQIIGGPVSPQVFTETHCTGDSVIVPRRRPLISVTSITPYQGTALTSDAYRLDTDLGAIFLRYGYSTELTVVYRAGWAVLPEAIKLAGLIIAQHLWRLQYGRGRQTPGEDAVAPGAGFAIPNRAAELLQDYDLAGIG